MFFSEWVFIMGQLERLLGTAPPLADTGLHTVERLAFKHSGRREPALTS
jgi:hypothetical protein